MNYSNVVRAFLINTHQQFLLVKHVWTSVWVLPGWHVEVGESFVWALRRELAEELWLDEVTVLGSRLSTDDRHVIAQPLPVSIHEVEYFSESLKKNVRKQELWYFAQTAWTPEITATQEVAEFGWYTYEQIMKMWVGAQVFESMKDVLEQNIDLLELLR